MLFRSLTRDNLTRTDVILALGGGVTGDLTGFAAATYLRGVPYLQLPTSLLAAVDSSVGGKTAIDLEAGKNMAGAFYQPVAVLCDTDALRSVPEEQWAEGMAEVIKYGMLDSPALLKELAEQDVMENLESIVAQCVAMKRDIVERDEFDVADRQLLNLGHTVGHAIERCSNYAVSHGRAVAMGMAVVTRSAVRQGLCSPDVLEVLVQLLDRYHLATATAYDAKELCQRALGDKKRTGNTITIVVPVAVGKSELRTIPVEELEGFIEKGLVP